MQDELKGCMNQDSLANAFGVRNILSLPVVYDSTECFELEYGRKEIDVLGNYFGSKHLVLRSVKDDGSENGFMVKPVLENAVLDKDLHYLEFSSARGEIFRMYRGAVASCDLLTWRYKHEG